MALRLVVFDIAGTTVNDDGGVVNHCLRTTLADHGFVVPAEHVDAVMGLAKPEALRILIGSHSDAPPDPSRVDTIHRDFVRRMIAHYASDPAVCEVEGVAKLFAELKRAGVMVALDTGFSREITDVILGRLGWRETGLVDAAISSDEVAAGRPAPVMIQELMRRLGVTHASEVAKVGDAPADLEEGRNAGCGWVIGVTWGTHTRDQLESGPHTHIADSVGALAESFLSITRAPQSSSQVIENDPGGHRDVQ